MNSLLQDIFCHVCGKSLLPTVSEIGEPSRSNESFGNQSLLYGAIENLLAQANSLGHHLLSPGTVTPIICELCKTASISNIENESNVSLSASEKQPFICTNCGDSFTHSRNFRAHLRSHLERRFECKLCDKAYTKIGSLHRHSRLHTGERPYECHICAKTFALSDTLRSHLRRHNNERPYICEHCGKTYTEAGHLRTHSRIHTGEKPYECEICRKSYSQSSHLYRHIKTHSGVRPYSCDLCDKSFSQTSHLQRHILSHTGERPYECQSCGKGFTNNNDLKRHMRCHATTKTDVSCDDWISGPSDFADVNCAVTLLQ